MSRVLPFGAASATSKTVNSRRLLALGASMLLAACASRLPPETTETKPTSALVGADVDVLCREVMVTGSHFSKRVCRTKTEWAQIEDASQAFTRGLQSDSTHNLAPVPTGGVVNPTPIGGPPVY